MDDPSDTDVRTGCPYCGVGCGLVAQVSAGRLLAVRGDATHPVNRGRTCAKPLALPEASRSPDRATTPLWREDPDAQLRPAEWDTVVPELARRLLAIRAEHGPGSIAFYVSGQLLTEDYYVVNKLAKGFLGTNHVDSNSRLCMSSAVAGYDQTFGSDGPPAAYADIEAADCFLLLGSNTAACHPILWNRIRERQAQGATVIVVDPRRTATAAGADLHLPVRPGTDLVLLSAMLGAAAREGLVDHAYLAEHAEGHEAALAAAAEWTPERAEAACGVPAGAILEAARRFAGAGASLAMWSMGANQQTDGTQTNRAIHALCVATGQIGRPGAGPLSLTGQPNAMGGREVGGLSHLLPGYRKVASAEDRAEMTALWNLPWAAAGISPEPGLPATDLFDALEDGRIKAVWIVATNPVVSMPDAERTRAALRRAELVICQDAYFPTETAALAHVVLPAAQWPEKAGTMTSSERRITLLRKAIDPPGSALPDWEIFARVARAMGFEAHFAWPDAAAVYDEFAALTAGRVCDQAGVSHARLEREGTLQWPCPTPEHPGTERLYADGVFPSPSGRIRLAAAEPGERADPTERDFPLTLTTGRIASQWHTMTRTAKSAKLMGAEPEPFVELHPTDALRAGVRDGELVRVTSRRGSATLLARLVPSLPRGTAFAPFHWGALHAPAGAGTVNDLTHRATDPTSRQPALKASAVRVEPVCVPERVTAGRSRPAPRRLLVVGTGPAAVATAEAVVAHAAPGAWEITLAGREPGLPYDRVALSEHLAGRKTAAALVLHDARWYAERGIGLRTGEGIEALDLEARAATTDGGVTLGYDALVLATGSRPLMPPIAGLDTPGVHAFRTRDDVRAILSAARTARRAVVVGGGLLGIEAARGLAARGVPVTLVHLADRLMERQLDPVAADLLARSLARLGIAVRCGRETTAILGEGAATGVRCITGEELEADLVVISAGIRPEVGLARDAGLDVDRAVVVDDALRTSAPGVWAVGECAQHRGVVQGLWAPILAQCRAAGATIAGVPAGVQGAAPSTRLKIAEIDLFCAGDPSAVDHGDDEIASIDTRAGTYRKLVLRGDRLVGATLLGGAAEAPRLLTLLRSGAPVPAALLGGAAPAAACEPDEDDLVCACNSVTHGRILSAARDGGLEHADEVCDVTRAATGCGSCRPAVESLLRGLAAERAAEAEAGAAPAPEPVPAASLTTFGQVEVATRREVLGTARADAPADQGGTPPPAPSSPLPGATQN